MALRSRRTQDRPRRTGRPLRYLLVSILADHHHPLTIKQLAAVCVEKGVAFNGRPSKIISDALRWELAKGRVSRRDRGVYRYDYAPRSTLYGIRQKVKLLRARLAELRQLQHSAGSNTSTSTGPGPTTAQAWASGSHTPVWGSGMTGYPAAPS